MPSCGKGPKMESSKQEKKNLMQDMPVVSKGMAMHGKGKGPAMAGSWMSKHCKVK